MNASILDLFQHKGIEAKKKTAKEWASPCPCCGGEDRCSIWPEDQEGRGYYWCRRCGAQGDGIQFLRDFCDMTYTEACKVIGVAVQPNLAPPRRSPGPNRREVLEPKSKEQAKEGGPDRALWRGKATAFAVWAHARIWEQPGTLAWLAGRGLDADAVARYGIGWNPGERGQNYIVRPREAWGLPPLLKKDGKPKMLWLPGGLVIPHLGLDAEGGNYARRLRIRRTDEDRARFNPGQKFFVVPGSEMDALFLPCSNTPGPQIVVVVESELDAFLLHHLAHDFVSVLAIGTSTVKTLPPDVFELLTAAACILVATDFDEPDQHGSRAGAEGWPRWNETFPRAKRWPVPSGKDPSNAFEHGEDLRLWLLAGIPAGLRFVMSAGPLPRDVPEEEGAEEKGRVPERLPDTGEMCVLPLGMLPRDCLADWLTQPMSPRDSLCVLARAGLRAVAQGNDFCVFGHERWPSQDTARLLNWSRKYGELVRQAVVR